MISTFVLYDGKAMWLFDPPLSQQALELLLMLIPNHFPYACSVLFSFAKTIKSSCQSMYSACANYKTKSTKCNKKAVAH